MGYTPGDVADGRGVDVSAPEVFNGQRWLSYGMCRSSTVVENETRRLGHPQ